MAKRVQIVGHAQAAADLFIGRVREITADITGKNIRLHDGVTAGGIKLARDDQVIKSTVVDAANDFLVGNNTGNGVVRKTLAQVKELLGIVRVQDVHDETFAAALVIDANDGDVFDVIVTADITSVTINNMVDSQIVEVRFIQDNTGNRTLMLGGGISTTYLDAPELSTAGNSKDVAWFEKIDSTIYIMAFAKGS